MSRNLRVLTPLATRTATNKVANFAGKSFSTQSFNQFCTCCNTTNFLCKNKKSMTGSRRNFFSFFGKKKAAETADDEVANSHPQIKGLLENNRKWVKQTNEKDPTFFPKLGQGQAPKYLYFGCSDSRVPANQILGLG
jgi:hypothetical protein